MQTTTVIKYKGNEPGNIKIMFYYYGTISTFRITHSKYKTKKLESFLLLFCDSIFTLHRQREKRHIPPCNFKDKLNTTQYS